MPDHYRHQKDSRANIPTQENERFMPDEEREPIEYTPPIREADAPRLAWERQKPDSFKRKAGPLYIHEM